MTGILLTFFFLLLLLFFFFLIKLCLNYEHLNKFASTQSAPGAPRGKHRVNFTQEKKMQKKSFSKQPYKSRRSSEISSVVGRENDPKVSV